MKKLIIVFSLLLLSLISGCGSNSEEAFSNWKYLYFDLEGEVADVIAIQYTITNDTEKNWVEDSSRIGYYLYTLEFGKNEYTDYYSPSKLTAAYKEAYGLEADCEKLIDVHSGISAGDSRTFLVCFRVNPIDFNEDLTGELHIKYDFIEHTQKYTYDDLTIISGLKSWEYDFTY